MARKQPKHATPKRRRPLRIALICLAAYVLVAGCVLGVHYLIDQGFFGESAQGEDATTASGAQGSSKKSAEDERKRVQATAATEDENGAKKPEGEAGQTPKKDVLEETRVQPARIDIMMIGDILMHDELVQSGLRDDGSYWFGFLYDHITDDIQAADLRVLNQETVMGSPDMGYALRMGAAGPIMNTPTALADTEVDYGFNLILKAHNHVLDLGYDGLAHELAYWKANYPEMPVVGVDNPYAEEGDDSQDYVNNVYVYEHDGMKVGILNYTSFTNEAIDAGRDAQVVSYLDEDKIYEDVEKARAAGAEMLVAFPHWGPQYVTTPSDEQRYWAQVFCDAGVDVIFGCHPHILQPVETLQNEEGHETVCFFSVGNFVAAGLMETDTLMGGIARATLERADDGSYSVTAASFKPTVICYTVGPHMSAYPLPEWTYDLAAESFRSALTPDYAYAFCADVLGEGFDPSTGIYTLR